MTRSLLLILALFILLDIAHSLHQLAATEHLLIAVTLERDMEVIDTVSGLPIERRN